MMDYQNMWRKIEAMSNHNLDVIWNALQYQDWGRDDMWGDGITMDTWAESIYIERRRRAQQ